MSNHYSHRGLVHRPLTTRSPRLALEGWTGLDEVQGRIPFDELPHLFNPDSGYISHANNLPVGSWYPYDLGLATGGTGDTGRSLRLRQLLEGERKFSVDDFEAVLHRDDMNSVIAALLPVARQVVKEDQIDDPAVLALLEQLDGWDLHDTTTGQYPAARSLRNPLTPYRGMGLNDIYGAGGGGFTHLAREVGEDFARNGSTPADPVIRKYLVDWLRSAAGETGNTVIIPYQSTLPLELPVVDSSLDLVSPPLTVTDQGTIWSQPGNLYSQIVDLANVDRSRSMIAPGNSEADPFRTNQVDLWVRGALHLAPLSRAEVEALGVTIIRLVATTYQDH